MDWLVVEFGEFISNSQSLCFSLSHSVLLLKICPFVSMSKKSLCFFSFFSLFILFFATHTLSLWWICARSGGPKPFSWKY